MISYYKAQSEGGKKFCRYYRGCGSTENCSRCSSYEKKPKDK